MDSLATGPMIATQRRPISSLLVKCNQLVVRITYSTNLDNYQGISVHHMVMNLGNDHLKLGEGIVKMIPILERLKRRRPGIRIVWLNQPPTIDSVTHKKGVYVRPVAVQSDKIHQYNQVTREILK